MSKIHRIICFFFTFFVLFHNCAAEKTSSIYIAAASYLSMTDSITFSELRTAATDSDSDIRIFAAETYLSEIKDLICADSASDCHILSADEEEYQTLLADDLNTLLIIPFRQIQPYMKVVNIDGQFPFARDFDPSLYALSTDSCEECVFDRSLLTSVALTGTTAITRKLAWQIDSNGLDYPTENIRDLLSSADITHISNEVSFDENCPAPSPASGTYKFCSDPSYIRILEDLGTDVVELTGNHNLDYGEEPYLYSLNIYEKYGMKTYGGETSQTEGLNPLKIEHNGNKIAWIGCNSVGPDSALASDSTPGAAFCNYQTINNEIRQLKTDGWNVIVTLQSLERPSRSVNRLESYPFYEIAKSDPDIISGSQAHIAQGFTFTGNTFVHFGLGNLLFDQTSEAERDAFVDFHYFYADRYIGSHLYTIRQEETMQPRFLDQEERITLLKNIAKAGN